MENVTFFFSVHAYLLAIADSFRSQAGSVRPPPQRPGLGDSGNSTTSSTPVSTPSRILAHCRQWSPSAVHSLLYAHYHTVIRFVSTNAINLALAPS